MTDCPRGKRADDGESEETVGGLDLPALPETSVSTTFINSREPQVREVPGAVIALSEGRFQQPIERKSLANMEQTLDQGA